MSVEVLDTAEEMMNQLRNSQSSRPVARLPFQYPFR